MGRLDEAREIIKRLRTMTPVVVPSATHCWLSRLEEAHQQGVRHVVT